MIQQVMLEQKDIPPEVLYRRQLIVVSELIDRDDRFRTTSRKCLIDFFNIEVQFFPAHKGIIADSCKKRINEYENKKRNKIEPYDKT